MIFLNAAEILLVGGRSSESGASLRENGRTLSVEDLISRAHSFALELIQSGVREGDRVALLLEKSSDALTAMFGVWLARGVIVPMYPGLKSRQLRHILSDSGASLIITTEERWNNEAFGDLKVLFPSQVKAQRRLAEIFQAEDRHQLAALLYTSGSTGLAKGVALSHENLIAGTRIVCKYLGLTASDRILSVLPWSFDAGLNQVLTALQVGATLVLPTSILAGDICHALLAEHVTGLAAIPPIWQQLAHERSPFLAQKFPDLRYMTNTGGALPELTVRKFQEHLPHVQIFLMYGLTEAFRSTYLPPNQLESRPTSIGKAIPETEILVIDESGKEVAVGEVGQLVHAGPTVTLGYWQNQEATEKKFKPHPLRPQSGDRVVYSGDLVRKDEEGYLYFVGRNDEMIKSQGHRVSPTEIENAIFESGMVQAVVVKEDKSTIAGSSIIAHCVPRDPAAFKSEELLLYCRKELPLFMIPREIFVHAAFATTASGKIDRKAL